MSNRRNFIKDISILGFAATVNPMSLFARPADPLILTRRVAVTTVIAIVQFAISAAKLFKGSSSNSGLLKLQIKMLENISLQLDVIKANIDIVSTKLDQVMELVGQMPREVVQELQSNSIQGYIGQFQTCMDFYKRVGYNPKRFSEIEEDINKLRANINTMVNQMIIYENYLNIPLIASAMFIEHNCMVFLAQSPEKISATMGTYRNYFRKMMYDPSSFNLEKRIEKIRLDRAEIHKEASLLGLYQGREFFAGNGWWFIRTGYYSHTLTPDLITDNEKISELISLGLIEQDERLQSFKANIVTKIGDKGFQNTYDKFGDLHPLNPVPVTSFPLTVDLTAKINNNCTLMENKFKLLTLQLYTSVSCKFAANRALNFCNQFDV